MAVIGPSAFYREPLPPEGLARDIDLLAPPSPLRGADLAPANLASAWSDGNATTQSLSTALASRLGYPAPKSMLDGAVEEAIRLGLFEREPGEGPAASECFRVVSEVQLSADMIGAALEYVAGQTPTLRNIKEAVEAHVVGRSVSNEVFLNAVRAAIEQGLIVEVDQRQARSDPANALATRVRRPVAALLAEANLDPLALQQLAERADQLLTLAPELAFTFRVTLTAEGERPDPELLERLNRVLDEIQPGWQLR